VNQWLEAVNQRLEAGKAAAKGRWRGAHSARIVVRWQC
jgi:hypothetical protein